MLRDVVVLISALLTVVGSMIRDRWLLYVCKPLTTGLILLSVIRLKRTRYRMAISIGLMFSLLGDVFLMIPGDWFLAGLSSFLVVHLAYLIAFTSDTPFAARRMPFVVWGLIGLVLLSILWPGIPAAMRLPVVGYVIAILMMASQSATRFQIHRVGLSAMIGAAFFILSDALIAFDRFRGPVPFASPIILATYYVSQWLIARSAITQIAQFSLPTRPDLSTE